MIGDNLPSDAPNPPGTPRVLVHLSPEAFRNEAVRKEVNLAIELFGGPLARIPYEVVFMEDASGRRGFVFVAPDIVYGLGPKKSRQLFDRVEQAVERAMRPIKARAQDAAAKVIESAKAPKGGA